MVSRGRLFLTGHATKGERSSSWLRSRSRRAIHYQALEAAVQGLVLLKNAGGALPLTPPTATLGAGHGHGPAPDPSVRTLALVGPFAAATALLKGSYVSCPSPRRGCAYTLGVLPHADKGQRQAGEGESYGSPYPHSHHSLVPAVLPDRTDSHRASGWRVG